ncbi:NUDIX hydrolase [Shewanella sp. 1_MG-2023]|uniref:NUDIX hydrolase n=1 Tax=unclassified Shewanella TaxID=196818 RepID=UPI0026E3D41E|nr:MULTISPECIES: NUDIX hydrolase [unclassified Shewanella]MDO6613397.1 NUDIX hydrolase [Shewanella sp. 7_MG-2023]MDO6770063.1 NUDIX hydrolase [Shewanella sp. 2_MG-2023]MDO6794825.1 NUDIX hydrolase [Shewanella sp. 1_MG-2023]
MNKIDSANHAFTGCKLALIFDAQLLVYRRDNIDSIPFPNLWDFPGGGREGNETPEQCVLRELHEEFSIALPTERLIYKQQAINQTSDGISFFFVAQATQLEIESIHFGDEGQYWQLMSIEEYMNDKDAILPLQQRLAYYLETK